MEHLLYSTGLAIGELVKFADLKVADHTMAKKRLILPTSRRLRKWITTIATDDATIDTATPDSLESGSQYVYGMGFKGSKSDPEHLQARTSFEKAGNVIRTIPRFLGMLCAPKNASSRDMFHLLS
jgi:hypothetical protein